MLQAVEMSAGNVTCHNLAAIVGKQCKELSVIKQRSVIIVG